MNTTFFSNFIEQQFPEFYRTDGAGFIQFVKAYYEWEETRSTTRSLLAYRDIDTTPDAFLDYFKDEYMSGVPKQILGDKRLLQKHILDLYNAKGSIEGIRLIFRLLYNEEIEFYIPAEDIFKLDTSEWFEPRYLEVSKFDTNPSFTNKNIVGTVSRAKAIVENYERRNVNGRVVDLLFISNIQGKFVRNENITFEGITIASPVILGSPDTVTVNGASPGFAVGDELVVTSGIDGKYFKGLVTEVKNGGQGIINFTLQDGGQGYTLNSHISVTAGTNTTGSGAAMQIISLANTFNVAVSAVKVSPYLAVSMYANNYASSNSDNSSMSTANLTSSVYSSLGFADVTFGKIDKIVTSNPGSNYDGTVSVSIVEPISTSLHMVDANGSYLGNNAVVTTNAFYGNGVPSKVSVLNSGFGYQGDVIPVTLQTTANDVNFVAATLVTSGAGVVEGYWRDSTSFLDSDKYLQDDDYYQEYSYELILKKKISEYYEVLKQTVHPTGNKMFGKIRLITES